jgi:uncharacterized YigZ family protein
VPAKTVNFFLRERGSKFIAHLFCVTNEEEIKFHLASIKQKYPDATHHCYGWVLNPDQSAQRSSDDGEPAGTAGKPIIRAILSAGITNGLIIVVRYFGGTQLGIPGLISAYGATAKGAIALAEIKEKYILDYFEIESEFLHENEIHHLIRQFEALVLESNYAASVKYLIGIRRSKTEHFLLKATENYLLKIIPKKI